MAFRYNDLGGADLDHYAGGKYEKARYAFPLEDRDRYASKLQFQIVKFIPPQFSLKFGTEETLDKASRGELDVKDFKGGTPATIELGAKCDLYMPQALQIADRFSYEQPGLGAAGAGALAAASAGQGLVGAASQAIEKGTQGISDFVGALSSGEVSRLGAVRIAQLQPFEGVANAVGIAAQAGLNPNIRAMFKQVGLRQFAFQFKFIPVSAEESRAIQDIIKFFRYHAYPKDIEQLGISFGYEFPEMFRIKAYTKQGGKYVQTGNHMKDCYLESISVTYNPTSATYHTDGMPTEYDLSLNFIEHKTLSKKDIERPSKGSENSSGSSPSLTDEVGSF